MAINTSKNMEELQKAYAEQKWVVPKGYVLHDPVSHKSQKHKTSAATEN